MGEQQQLAGLQLVAFRDVLENVVYDAHAGLRQLAERLPSLGDQERCVCGLLCPALPYLRLVEPNASNLPGGPAPRRPHRCAAPRRRRSQRCKRCPPPARPLPPCSKRQLLQHLQTTRQRLQRLHVCAQWGHKAKAVNTCREVLKASQDHGAALMHAGLWVLLLDST